MVAQKCLGAKTNSPRKFALVSCIELPKRTQNKLDFGLILLEITYQFVLRFRLKYIGALTQQQRLGQWCEFRAGLFLWLANSR